MAWRSHLFRAFTLAIGFAVIAPAAESPAWNMRETSMSDEGRLTLSGKPWWARAKALNERQSFTLDLNGDGRPDYARLQVARSRPGDWNDRRADN